MHSRALTEELKPPVDPVLRLRALFQRKTGDQSRFPELPGADAVRPLYGARYGIFHALHLNGSLRDRYVLAPAFHCPSVIDPILHAGGRVRFYHVRGDLGIDLEDFESKLDSSVSAAILVRFFGFPGNVERAIAICRARGVTSIDDAAHSFLEANPTRLTWANADATVYSFKKLLPTVAGGGIRFGSGWHGRSSIASRAHRPTLPHLRELHSTWMSKVASPPSTEIASAVAMDRLSRAIPAVRRPAEVSYPYDPHYAGTRMPAASRLILSRTSLDDVAAARRRNFAIYAEQLRAVDGLRPLHESLTDATCPWGFPVVMSNRASHDYRLRALGVPLFTFGETLHPLIERFEAEHSRARPLSEQLLVFSVHQHLTYVHVERYCAVINKYISHHYER